MKLCRYRLMKTIQALAFSTHETALYLDGHPTDTRALAYYNTQNEKLRDAGVNTVIYTDISKDGMLSGTNLEIFGRLNEIEGLNIIASGGITFDDEIKTLRDMNIYAAIVGKAVYENKLDLARAVRIADGGAFD